MARPIPLDAPVTTATGFGMGGIYRIAAHGRHPASVVILRSEVTPAVILRSEASEGSLSRQGC